MNNALAVFKKKDDVYRMTGYASEGYKTTDNNERTKSIDLDDLEDLIPEDTEFDNWREGILGFYLEDNTIKFDKEYFEKKKEQEDEE